LTDQQRRGKQLYILGTSPSGRPVGAFFGASREAVPAALVPCANCHGRDGRGRPEGGIEPPDLTWAALTRPLATGRRGRPAYTAALVGRAVTEGLDPTGKRLGDGMPRYRLAPDDLADLVAYLHALGTEIDPGITPTSLTLGTLLPPKRTAPALREAIARTQQAFVEDLNRRGGIYNRALRLECEDLPEAAEGAAQAVATFLRRRQVFALLAPYIAGQDQAVARAANDEAVPLLGPFTVLPPADFSPNRHVFHIHSGLEGQARALAGTAMSQGRATAPAIVRGDDATAARATEAVAEQWARGNWPAPEQIVLRTGAGEACLPRIVEHLAKRRTDVLVYLGPPALLHPLGVQADKAAWRPRVYLPGALAGGRAFDLPLSFANRVFLALPYLAEDVSREGQDEYDRLHAQGGLPRQHLATQLAVLAAAKALEEGLRRCGRDVSRARLVAELERLDDFSTGYSRPLTFGPNRRVGSWGAYMFRADLAGRRLESLGWASLGGER
jgi:ABC-type branched-subunit amino acid transport system substrate-binding protein